MLGFISSSISAILFISIVLSLIAVINLIPNYTKTGYIQLTSTSLKIFIGDILVQSVDIRNNNLQFMAIRKGGYFNRFVFIAHQLSYWKECVDTFEFAINSTIYSYDILLDNTTNENKRIKLLFRQMENIGIKTYITDKALPRKIIYMPASQNT
jgi:hypothetical protein